MGKTKKVGIAGRFGPRYGSNVKKKWKLVMDKMKGPIKCPRCETKGKVKRLSTGIWHCKKCNATFTGGAYYIDTSRGLESFRTAVPEQEQGLKEIVEKEE